jgi:hypothetical protein
MVCLSLSLWEKQKLGVFKNKELRIILGTYYGNWEVEITYLHNKSFTLLL